LTYSELRQRFSLLIELTKREVLTRYRGSTLGLLWSLVTPLFMLAVFTFVFGSVFKVRWGVSSDLSKSELALMLFSGLVVFNLFSESVLQAPTAVSRNANYVKRIVFPLELLPVVYIAAALFHGAISLLVLLVGRLIIMGSIPITALLVPIVLLPMLLTTLGACWFLAAIGVFLRDVGQTIGLLMTALMFLSPIFYPLSALPPAAAKIIGLNPMSHPIEDVRSVLLLGTMPDWQSYLISLAIGLLVAWIGLGTFTKIRRGFADVL
jgi:lipopolysaccharide transport system permease protein